MEEFTRNKVSGNSLFPVNIVLFTKSIVSDWGGVFNLSIWVNFFTLSNIGKSIKKINIRTFKKI